MLGGIGKALNSFTGASASASKAHNSAMTLQGLSFKQQKEFAKNAHQWEMQDLQKAGLNPALTATGGSGASAGGAGGGAGGAGVGAGQSLDVLGMINQTRLTNAQIEKLNADIDNVDAQTGNIIEDTENKEWENKFWKWGEDALNGVKNFFNNGPKPSNDSNSAGSKKQKKQVFSKKDLLG